jgi:nucleoid-associated protein YgaU
MVSMDVGVGAVAGAAVGIGVGIASVMTGGVPAMIRCLEPDALGLVLFDFNPSAIKMDRKPNTTTTPSRTQGASTPISQKTKPPTINLSKVIFVGEDTKMRVDTLFAWCAPPAGLITAIVGLFTVTSTVQPTLTFQWGPPMLGFMYDVKLTQVTANYTRFHSSGIPIRAELTIAMQTVPNIMSTIPTNPTSGGQPGRSTHLMRDGESLQSIAQTHYGRPGVWRKIAEINGITDPNRVRPGTTVYLPGPAEITAGGR